MIEDEFGKFFKQEVKPKWIPKYCKKYNAFGHLCQANKIRVDVAPIKLVMVIKKWVAKKKLQLKKGQSSQHNMNKGQQYSEGIEWGLGTLNHITPPINNNNGE